MKNKPVGSRIFHRFLTSPHIHVRAN